MSSKKVTLSKNALEVAESRYFNNGEDWEECCRRVATTVASIEKEKIVYTDKFFEMIYNMDFIPGGRILRNAGRQKGSMLNCYHLYCGDSIEEIGQFMKECLIVWASGGGCGTNMSLLRPKGDPILGKGGASSGMLSFLIATDAISKTIESGGQRRAAGLASLEVSHPEILDFIDAKTVHGDISHFNISVMVNDEFLEAVERDKNWDLKFKQKIYKTVKARDIWDKIIYNMIHHAEPGLLNTSNLMKNNSYYFAPISGVNPCITGETLVYVADGRGHVPIKVLEQEGKDIPVFSFNEINKKVEVKMMRHPRITGYNKKILKISLDDGSFIRCNENHRFYMKDGSKKEAKDLMVNDRLEHLISYNAPLEEIFKGSNSKSQDYRWILKNGQSISEHRLIASFKIGRDIKNGEVVHHCNMNGLNNNPENLEVMTKIEHDKFHGNLIRGDNNPMRRFPEKNYFLHHKFNGIENGNSYGFTREEMIKKARNFILEKQRHILIDEWVNYCKENHYPYYSKYIWGDNCNTLREWLDEIEKDLGFGTDKIYKYKETEHERYLELKDETDLDIFWNGEIVVRKKCEGCDKYFLTSWNLRERTFCDKKCFNHSVSKKNKLKETYKNKYERNKENIYNIFMILKDKLNRNPLLIELIEECKNQKVSLGLYWKKYKEDHPTCFGNYKDIVKYVESRDFNYRIVSIEEDGYENVYNGTVEDNHNFYSMVKESTTESGNPKYNYILSAQCGEAVLSASESCCLGSLVLPNFITGNVNTNWQKLERAIKLSVRFLDNVVDTNVYNLKKIDEKTHDSRRIGLGIMGLADYLFSKQLRYGSKEAISEIERLVRFIRDVSYQTSIELATEKGSFPKFDPIMYGKASFVRKLPATLRMDIKNHGIRNVTLMSFAPTGTLSLLAECTGGIEPLMHRAYRRVDRVGERIYIHPKYKELLLKGIKTPDWFVDMNDLDPREHFETQSICQKYCDGGISKTANFPEGTTEEQLSTYLLEYIHDLKGITVYVDKTREGQIYNQLTEVEVLEYLALESVSNELDADDIDCNCQKKKEEVEPEVCEIPQK